MAMRVEKTEQCIIGIRRTLCLPVCPCQLPSLTIEADKRLAMLVQPQVQLVCLLKTQGRLLAADLIVSN